jgi:hypothetical protein
MKQWLQPYINTPIIKMCLNFVWIM